MEEMGAMLPQMKNSVWFCPTPKRIITLESYIRNKAFAPTQ